MLSELKQRIIRDNTEATSAKIKELSENYGIDVETIEEYLKSIIQIVLSNDVLEIEDDMSDVLEVLEEVTSDQSYVKEQDRKDAEASNGEVVGERKPAEESITYFIKDKYGYAFEKPGLTEDELDEAIKRTIKP